VPATKITATATTPIITKKTFDSLMNVEIPIPAVKKGDHVRIAIDAGSEQNPIQGLLGAAIRLIAPPQYLNLAEFIPSEFLASQNLIPFIHYNEQTFELSLALTRTRLDGGVNGFGKIAELEFVATETIPEGFKINLVSAVISSESGLNYSPSLGVEVAITTNVENVQNIPTEFSLSQNYPNPFNPSTQISFDVPQNGMVSIQVFNMLGQQVATLLNRELNVGSHTVNFDASNLSSGMYLYSLKAGNVNITKKMMLIK